MSGEKWTERDHLVSTYLYKYGTAGLGLTLPEVADRLHRSDETILKRFQNYRYVETKGQRGLPGWNPDRIGEVLATYSGLPQDEHLRLIREALELDTKTPVNGRAWSDDELIIAVFLYRFGWEDLGVPYVTLGHLMGRRPSTIIYRLANFMSYDGVETGLNHGGKHALKVYDQHRDMPRDVLRSKAMKALLHLSGQNNALLSAL